MGWIAQKYKNNMYVNISNIHILYRKSKEKYKEDILNKRFEIGRQIGKSNKTGIRIVEDTLIWNGLEIPVVIDYDNYYEYQAIQYKICYNRIVRKYVTNKYKYYVQIVFKGNPPIKIDTATGEIKHDIGNGDVGLDIGTRTVAISIQPDVKILELADRVQNIE